MTDTAVVIVAAGKGERAGGGRPKQYRDVAGRPLLAWTLERFTGHPRIGRLEVVIDPSHRELYQEAVSGFGSVHAATGGATRQESVLAGLRDLGRVGAPEIVMIHDAARPFVAPALIGRLLAAVDGGSDGAIPVVPVADTLKRCRAGLVEETVERGGLARAQTPQAFRFRAILAAHEEARGRALTDDAAVAEAAGLAVAAVPGDEANLKVTTADDIAEAERRLGGREPRTGIGFDVHAFTAGDHVVLCGVRIEHDRGLGGDSDADVGLHVLVDALLGALGEGDLGRHFPPGDPAWKGRASADLVAVACALMARRGARLVNVDITLICERPRLARHQPAMRARVASLLGVAEHRVNVKVTSTDGLGFCGRGEGIAGQAVATLDVPARPS